MKTKNQTGKIAVTGLLGALALVLSFLEGLVPPLPAMPPGAKLGLSNIATMFAAGYLGLPGALFTALIKGGFAFLSRGVTAGAMSLSGALLSALVGWFLLKKTGISFLTTGILCAVSHNMAQLAVAYWVSSVGILSYLPALLFFGVCSGSLTGLMLFFLYDRLELVGNFVLGKESGFSR